MKILIDRIRREGENLGGGILRVDSFLNHQVDVALMYKCGEALAARFFPRFFVTKVLTAEISGIAPAVMTAMFLNVPILYARRTKPITMPERVYSVEAASHTRGQTVTLMVSPEFLKPDDKIIIIDDFLASGQTILALDKLVRKSGGQTIGVGTCIEKVFERGREILEARGLVVESLVKIKKMTDDHIVFAEER